MSIKKIENNSYIDEPLFIGVDLWEVHKKMIDDACKMYNAVVHPSCIEDGEVRAFYDSNGVSIESNSCKYWYGLYILLKSRSSETYYLLDTHEHYYLNLDDAYNDEADELIDIINADPELPREDISYGWYYISSCFNPQISDDTINVA